MTPAAILLLALTIFTGFVIPTPNMHGWCRWINYLDPLAYAFESLIANEFHNRDFECSQYVPSGGSYPTAGPNRICTPVEVCPAKTLLMEQDTWRCPLIIEICTSGEILELSLAL